MGSRVKDLNKFSYNVANTVRFVEPVVHGSQRSVITTRMLYFAAIDAWRRSGDVEFSIDYYSVRFYSKKSGLYRYKNGEYKRLFEYVIHVRDQIGHKKLDVVIKPRIRGMYYYSRKLGKFVEFKLPKGQERTLLFVQSSYMEWDEVLELLTRIFEKLDINKAYLAEVDVADSSIITKERHVRVSISVERAVAETLKAFEFWLRDQPGSKVRMHIDNEEDVYKFYKVTFKNVDIIPEQLKGLGLAFYVKMYRLKDWETANAPENIKHSFKFEAGIDPKLSSERVPLELDGVLTDFLDQLVISILVKTGVQKLYSLIFQLGSSRWVLQGRGCSKMRSLARLCRMILQGLF